VAIRSSVAELLLFAPISPPAVKEKLGEADWDWDWMYRPAAAALRTGTI